MSYSQQQATHFPSHAAPEHPEHTAKPLLPPALVRHRPVAENATIMMVEHQSTVNTGDEAGSERTKHVVDVRGS